ncbi:hypothetical protein KFK09_023930 [Dendrobium nobile]|uniref:Uncharacterized protein n=1 Tax=Dendrobium nobile TaxID=94219 RepID=A0A8T3AHV3_DENNO|nr:hypothetical protein KFK09_023930 [Dendrobium nobile]
MRGASEADLNSFDADKVLISLAKCMVDQREPDGNVDVDSPIKNVMLTGNKGANKREASLYLKEYIKKWDVFFVGIIETKIASLTKDDFVKIMGEEWNFFLQPSRGNSGGIMVIWNTNVASFSVTMSSDQCVLGELEIFNKSKWMIATIYGSREFQGRRELWRSMDGIVEHDTPPVIGVVRRSWAKPVIGDDMEAVNKKMSRVLKALFFWSKDKHQKLEELKETLRKEIEELQQDEASELLFSDSKSLLLISKVKEFNCTLARLNTWWKKRAKAKWMKEGDVNSSFFHAFANGRRNGNSIKQLLNEEGELTEDPACIRRSFYHFFCKKWEYRNSDLSNWPLNRNVLKTEDCNMLESVLTMEEVEKVIEEFGNNISPGLDGITYSFLKAYWKIIGMDVWIAIQLVLLLGKCRLDGRRL